MLALIALSRFAPLEEHLDVPTADGMLGAATVSVGALLSVLLWLRFRLSRDAVALWISVAVLVFAVFTVAVGQLLPLLDSTQLDTSVAAWVRPAGLVVTLALLLFPLWSPEVDTRLRPSLMTLAALGAVMWVTTLLQLVPGLTRYLVGTEPVLSPSGHLAVEPAVGLAWVALAFTYLTRGLRRHRALAAWTGLALYALAIAELSSVAATVYGPTWQLGAGGLRLVGMLLGCVGAVRELQLSFAVQNDRMLEVHVDALAREARIEAQLAERAERAHEARNALAAIEGATLTLDRNREALDPRTREILTAAVTTEIARLQQLVSDERAAGTLAEFDLAGVIDSQLALARSRGARVLADVPEGLTAVGRSADTAEALQNLLLNAQKYAPGSPILVRASDQGQRVVVRVEDRGPGIADADRERIFDRGERASEGHGDGLGLYVARQLFREQDGDLWLEGSRPGTGACFAFSLPANSAAREGDDHVGDVTETGEVEHPVVVSDLDRPAAGPSGIGGNPHDDISAHVER